MSWCMSEYPVRHMPGWGAGNVRGDPHAAICLLARRYDNARVSYRHPHPAHMGVQATTSSAPPRVVGAAARVCLQRHPAAHSDKLPNDLHCMQYQCDLHSTMQHEVRAKVNAPSSAIGWQRLLLRLWTAAVPSRKAAVLHLGTIHTSGVCTSMVRLYVQHALTARRLWHVLAYGVRAEVKSQASVVSGVCLPMEMKAEVKSQAGTCRYLELV